MSKPMQSVAAQIVGGLDRLLRGTVENWMDRLEAQSPGALRQYLQAGGNAADLGRLVACSEFAAGVLLRNWEWFAEAIAAGTMRRAHDRRILAARLSGELDDCDSPDEFKRRLRVLRQRVSLAVLWRELIARGSLDETLVALSDFADLSIASAVRYANTELKARYGRVLDDNGAVPLVVLAMGKLGGRELNFSSDIDLIFLYPGGSDSDGERSLSAQEYFTRYSRKVVTLLEEMTPDGYVFRVDTRLRPFGDSGAPVAGFAALESYLLQHGRGWERYAYVKARIVTPGPDSSIALALRQDVIEPFVYRRYLDYGVFESLREMHRLVAAEVQRRDLLDNVKLGPGGIREIEFIVQSLQLVRGGSVPALRSVSLAESLSAAAEQRELTRDVAEHLMLAYRFLRRLENAIQALRDQQTHMLPQTEADRARIAYALNYRDWNALASDLEEHRRYVAAQFAAVAFRTGREPEAVARDGTLATLWESHAGETAWRQAFDELGISDSAECAKAISAFAGLPATLRVDVTAARRLRQFITNLLARLATVAGPAVTLQRVLHVVEQVLRRSAYLALLNENPAVLGRLVDLCSKSSYLAEEIARFPILLDELLDARLAAHPPTQAEMRADLEQRRRQGEPGDSEQQIELLAQFQRAILFRLAVADFSGTLPIMKVSDRLTELAEIILDEALNIAWKDTVARFGAPTYVVDGRVRPAGLGIIGYGKLGGIELSYRSDLDIVFLHDSRGESQQTDAVKPLENSMFFGRLVRRLVHFLTTQTGSGVLYDVDTRLRPSGRSGLLVTSLEAFERYQEENAWTWEHQALLRSRPVAGSALVAREFERIRSQTLRQRVRRDTLAVEVANMRARMRKELDRSDDARFDLKQGRGGIGDIEFLVQYLVLAHAARHPAVIHYTDNIRQLGTLAAARCLPEPDSLRLQEIYKAYRSRLHRLALDDRPPF
ncbi:MAG: bifunctional [glutamate--ammonia ligase]-adenylyl-L-tyrosine phosphorylase/[glutamate--ammonia-ligase] adenylyltransferase, partial [Gammaproteobacteria bacterium]|nr:bifunctional [glutamate--ammonia ligase]-adenylyl-L-tyrosine phosphorylase/[glutamate--ammonia-ligase] adenylyltransferase [Gammaproteobacteria bacterium]